MKNSILAIILIILSFGITNAQNVFPASGAAGIGTLSPSASSSLDISSTTSGLLIPRMTKVQRDAIATPATGLLIYQTNSTPGFYYYTGTLWTAISSKGVNASLSNLSAPTAVNQTLSPGVDNSIDLGTSANSWRNIYLDGSIYTDGFKYVSNSGTTSTFIGNNAGNINAGSDNSGVGANALTNNTSGSFNTAVGSSALLNNNAQNNSAVGAFSLYNNTTGNGNTALGGTSLYSNTSGGYNVAIGDAAAYHNTSGNYNCAIGENALTACTTGSSNTAIGSNTLRFSTVNSGIVAVGDSSLYSYYDPATPDPGLVSVGNKALKKNMTGTANTAVGSKALTNNTTGISNTAIGWSALSFNNGSFNTACGTSALISNNNGQYNTAVGNNALLYNYSGNLNTAVGSNALYTNSSGVDNTAIGAYSLYFNTGSDNTSVGYYAMGNNTTGFQNIAFGALTLGANTTGNSNSAAGYNSGVSNTTGSANTYFGWRTGYSSVSANDNSAFGYDAGYNMTGSENTLFGSYSGHTITTGTKNTCLGRQADVSSGAFINSIAIGYQTTSDASNKVRIGNAFIVSNGGQVNWTAYSDARIKNNIQQNVPGLEFINALRPVTFHYDVDKENALLGIQGSENWDGKYDIEKIAFSGFIAQEVEAAAQSIGYNFSGIDNTGNIKGLRYAEFVVPLVRAVQQLDSVNQVNDGKIKTLENAAIEQERINQDLKQQINTLKALLPESGTGSSATINLSEESTATSVELSDAWIEQNAPNPFTGVTVVRCFVPDNSLHAELLISTEAGTTLTHHQLPDNGLNTINIDARNISAGNYTCSLIIDGKVIGAVQMVVVK